MPGAGSEARPALAALEGERRAALEGAAGSAAARRSLLPQQFGADISFSGALTVLRVSHPCKHDDGVMNFSELELYTAAGGNVARAGSASQSSTYDGNPNCGETYYCGACSDIAAAAIDGNLCTYQAEFRDAEPWWEVKLARPYAAAELASVNLYPRNDNGGPNGWAWRIDGCTLSGLDAQRTVLFSVTLPDDASNSWPVTFRLAAAAASASPSPASTAPTTPSASPSAGSGALASASASAPAPLELLASFSYTGAAQTFTVPPGLSFLRVSLWGAGGGGGARGAGMAGCIGGSGYRLRFSTHPPQSRSRPPRGPCGRRAAS